MTDGTTQKVVDYLDGFQYAGGVLQFFPHPEGYVKATAATPTNTSYYYDYVYNYTDHLGNVRLSYSKDPLTNQLKIMDETHYYPFGLKHSVYIDPSILDFEAINDLTGGTKISSVQKTDYQYKYNGKELQDELGLGWYDYQARNYDPALGRWMNIDPLAEVSRRFSPYAYVYNNPLRFIDPDGMKADDVIIKGNKSQEALAELQKATQGQVNLSLDSSGNLSYTTVSGATVSSDTQQLINAIDDNSITVNVLATDSKVTSQGGLLEGGAFMGNTVTTTASGNTVSTNQEINPDVLSSIDSYFNSPGTNTLHEVTESYQGGVNSQQSGVSALPATPAEVNNPSSSYNQAHSAATPQVGSNYIRTVLDAQGNKLTPNSNGQYSGAAQVIYQVQDGNKPPKTVMTYP